MNWKNGGFLPPLKKIIKHNAIHLRFAYSLVELMISLIAISVITAAVVPVITKKMKRDMVNANPYSITSKCDFINSSCALCDKDTKACLVCNRICSGNTYKDISTCLCKSL